MRFEFKEQDFLNDLKMFLRIKSVNSDCGTITQTAPLGQGIYDSLDYMLTLGEKFGFHTKNVDGYCGWIEMGEGNDMVAILAHVDTVATDDGWTYPPFDTTIIDGRVYGRGTSDDKGPALIALYAMKAVKDAGIKLNKRVRLILGGDEESEWRCLQRYRETEELPLRAFTPDADYPVTFAEKGILVIKLSTNYGDEIPLLELDCGHTINIVPAFAQAILNGKRYIAQGKAAHAMCPELGINALLKLCDQLKENITHPILKLSEKLNTSALAIDFMDEASGKLTFNPAIAHSDAHEAFVYCDIRIPVTIDKQKVINQIIQNVKPLGFTLHETAWEPPLYVEKNSPLVQALQKVYYECTGDNRQPVSTGGGTYARAFKNAVAFGALLPGDEHTYHKNDEYWSLTSIRTNFQIISNAIIEI